MRRALRLKAEPRRSVAPGCAAPPAPVDTYKDPTHDACGVKQAKLSVGGIKRTTFTFAFGIGSGSFSGFFSSTEEDDDEHFPGAAVIPGILRGTR